MPRVAPEVRARREVERRTQILEAAARVFSRKGFAGATVREIAQEAGLAEGSIYNYFRSKEALLIHIPRQFVQPVLAPLAAAAPGPRSPAEAERQLLALAGAIVARMRAQAPFLKVFVSALPYLSPAARRQYLQLLPTYATEMLERFLRDGMRRGIFRRDLNPAVAARAFPGMLLIFVMMQEILLGRRLIPHGYEEIVPEAVRIFLHGATPRGARPRTTSHQGGRT